ncbi:MAG: glycosyltransferase [Ruminococcus sp.]|nr:glycosyltransferase [Ruminococcus sp.]
MNINDNYKSKIAVVLVTYNRKDCLKVALEKYEVQTLAPKYIIVVDNKSSDGTSDFLRKWESIETKGIQKVLFTMQENVGGAGGFAKGLDLALGFDVDWIWIADDDAYPEDDVLKVMVDAYENMTTFDTSKVAALCSSVVNKGQFDLSHRRRVEKHIKGIKFVDVPFNEYNNEYFEINQGSYVGMLVKKDKLLKVGLTRKDFFIYYDDTEHSTRLNQEGKIICIPRAKVIHDAASAEQFSWKNYYGFRNVLLLLDSHYGKYYAVVEAVKRYLLFVAAWNKKYSRSIRKMLWTGIIDGLKGESGIHKVYKPGWQSED